MSFALWCDLGQHAYPQGQQGSTQLKVVEQVKNQWGGTQPSEVVKDICAACAKDFGYRNLKTERTQDEVDEEAEDIRERSGGIFKRRALGRSRNSQDDITTELEDENRDLRIAQLEREIEELRTK